jgi:hypothetical protein
VAERFLIKKISFTIHLFSSAPAIKIQLYGAIFYPQTPPSLLSKSSPPSQQNIELCWNFKTIYGG